MTSNNSCIFCKIATGLDEKTEILLSNDLFIVFKDIRPATPHHYLIVTKQHITDAKHLKNTDITLVEGMISTGLEVLNKQDANTKDVRMGFHWPPFHSISHLHLHVIADTDKMGWIARGIFKLNSYWFVSVHCCMWERVGNSSVYGLADWLLERLKKMKPAVA